MSQILIYYDYECEEVISEKTFGFSLPDLAASVAEEALREEGCPFDAEVNLLVTDDESIREANREMRGMDRVTDVLSFPVYEYSSPSAFEEVMADRAGSYNPESGRFMLGDIMISAEQMKRQAEEYGHSVKREFSFLVAHSVLHLLGYDHMTEDEESVMFGKQELILDSLNITREL